MDYARKNNKRGAQLFPEALSWLVVVYLGIVVLATLSSHRPKCKNSDDASAIERFETSVDNGRRSG